MLTPKQIRERNAKRSKALIDQMIAKKEAEWRANFPKIRKKFLGW